MKRRSQQDWLGLFENKILIVEGDFGYADFSGGFRVRARKLYDIDTARQHFAKYLELGIDHTKGGNGFVDSLRETLKPYRIGLCPGSRSGCEYTLRR